MGYLKSIIRLVSAVVLVCSIPLVSIAANVCDPTTGTRCVTVDTNLNARTNLGVSTRTTYGVTTTANTAATAHTLSIEASAGTGYKLVEWCVGLSNATAASSVNVILNRRTTASTGGTALTNNGTGNTAITALNTSGTFGGIGRLDGTPGTLGATIEAHQVQIGIIATGAGGSIPFCKRYGNNGEMMPAVAAGVANGISISVPSLGAGSLATSITAIIIEE